MIRKHLHTPLSTTGSLSLVVGFLLCAFAKANAGEVDILSADFQRNSGKLWSANVTLKHDDMGWDHYADGWRVVDGEGKVLGNRVLFHPHVKEQPFTRGLSNIEIPDGVTKVFVEAHDKVHGWSRQELEIDLSKASNGKLRITAP